VTHSQTVILLYFRVMCHSCQTNLLCPRLHSSSSTTSHKWQTFDFILLFHL